MTTVETNRRFPRAGRDELLTSRRTRRAWPDHSPLLQWQKGDHAFVCKAGPMADLGAKDVQPIEREDSLAAPGLAGSRK
jgi:hypothetical protein